MSPDRHSSIYAQAYAFINIRSELRPPAAGGTNVLCRLLTSILVKIWPRKKERHPHTEVRRDSAETRKMRESTCIRSKLESVPSTMLILVLFLPLLPFGIYLVTPFEGHESHSIELNPFMLVPIYFRLLRVSAT